jgi:hypothetical protein
MTFCNQRGVEMKFVLSKEWCTESARIEGDAEVGAGLRAFAPSSMFWTELAMQADEDRADTRRCATCEYFDAHNGDCLNSHSPRFQTTADQTCNAWHRDTTA